MSEQINYVQIVLRKIQTFKFECKCFNFNKSFVRDCDDDLIYFVSKLFQWKLNAFHLNVKCLLLLQDIPYQWKMEFDTLSVIFAHLHICCCFFLFQLLLSLFIEILRECLSVSFYVYCLLAQLTNQSNSNQASKAKQAKKQIRNVYEKNKNKKQITSTLTLC